MHSLNYEVRGLHRRISDRQKLIIVTLVLSALYVFELLILPFFGSYFYSPYTYLREFPQFEWNYSSMSGFKLGSRGGMRQWTLRRGETGSIELLLTSTSSRDLMLRLFTTLDGSDSQSILPPGVSAEFSPSIITLQPGENVSVPLTMVVDRDAPGGAYYYHAALTYNSSGERVRVSGASVWLVIEPYTPSGNFSLVECRTDFVARESITIIQEVWRDSNGTYGFVVRSEGPPLTVELEIANVDVPEEVKLSMEESRVSVQAGSQAMVTVLIETHRSTQPGRYLFQVLAKSGSEIHTATFEIEI